ncbi:MAG: MFS transporter [Ilumatobacteraceae bacterium]
MRAPTSFRVFRHGSFAILWSGSLVSNVGTWMETVALGRYVQEQTGEAKWAGLVAAAGFLPTAVVGLLGGALADRVSRQRLIIVASLLQATFAGVLTWMVAAGTATPGWISLFALLGGCGAAIGFPAWQTAVPDMVPTDEVPAAIGLSSVQWNLGRVVGPALAGIVMSVWGITAALLCNVVSFFAVTIAAAVVRIPPRVMNRDDSILRTVADGWRLTRRVPALRVMSASMWLSYLLAAPFIALIPAMVDQVLQAGRGANSALVTAQGIGAVTAGVLLGSIVARWGLRHTMVRLMCLLAPALVAYGLAPNIWWMAPALAVVGAAYMGCLSTFSTIGQTRAPDSARGRVMAINNATLGVLYPIGAVAQGALGDRVGLRTVTVGAGVLMLLVMLAVRVMRPGFTAPLGVQFTEPSSNGDAVPTQRQ